MVKYPQIAPTVDQLDEDRYQVVILPFLSAKYCPGGELKVSSDRINVMGLSDLK